MLQSVFLLIFLIGVGWLFYWAIMVERRPMGEEVRDRVGNRVRARTRAPGGGGRPAPGPDRSPFAMRDPADFHRRHGDRTPL